MPMTKLLRHLSLAAAALWPFPLSAAAPGLFGDWKTTEGSVVRTFPCSQALCMKIIALGSAASGARDQKNPDASLRNRSLCNLEIGSSFTLSGGTEATGGRLYDPESGKTYKGNISLDGNRLKLRGYIGFAVFGRTETWQRAADVKPCA